MLVSQAILCAMELVYHLTMPITRPSNLGSLIAFILQTFKECKIAQGLNAA